MRHYAIAAMIMSLAVSSAARADVYRSVDAQGHVQYSDTPSPGAELVHVQRGADTGTSTASPASPATGSTSTTSPGTRVPAPATPPVARANPNAQAQETIDRQTAQRAVQQDLEQTRADQCKKATDDYQASLQARRIYRTGPNGEHEYLTDEETDQQRMNLRLAMQNACGSSP
jgi:hypothetical protein